MFRLFSNNDSGNKGDNNNGSKDIRAIIKKVLILVFAGLVVFGVMHTYFADWTLKAEQQEAEKFEEGENITSEEDISIESEPDLAAEKAAEEAEEEAAESAEEETASDESDEPQVIEMESRDSKQHQRRKNLLMNSEPVAAESGSEGSDEPMEVKVENISRVSFEGEDFTVTVTDSSAGLPADTVLKVEELLPDSDEYKLYSEQAKDAVSSENGEEVGFARFFDITLISDGKKFEPENPVNVNITFGKKMQKELDVKDDENVRVLHFTEDKKTGDIETEIIDDNNVDVKVSKEKLEEAEFEAESFSVYGVVSTATIEKSILASDGHNYKVTVNYGDDAGVPSGAELDVHEITSDSAGQKSDGSFDKYVSEAESALGLENGSAAYIRLFDITIVDRNGEKVEIKAPVEVRIELADKDSSKTAEDNTKVVHFADSNDKPDVVESVGVDGDTVRFEAGSFSVYAIVEAPEPYETETKSCSGLSEFREHIGEGYFLSINKTPAYLTGESNGKGCFTETKDMNLAAEWTFDQVQGKEDQYYISTVINGTKMYIRQESSNSNNVLLDSTGTAFTVEDSGDGTFTIKHAGQDRWLQHSNGGGGIRFYTDKNNKTNSSFTFTYASSTRPPDDVYELDGKTYGIAFNNDTVSAAALMGEAKDSSHLASADMLIRPDVLDNEGVLLVAAGSNITFWTFESVSGDEYYITTTVEGKKKYLTLDGQKLTMEDAPDPDHSVIRVVPGTGANSGKYSFTVGKYCIELNLNGTDTSKGFWGTTGSNQTKWLNLVRETDLEDDVFTLYSAKKVSVSDDVNVHNGAEVVIYTRVWNDTAKRYEFYVVTGDGSLARCYDTGDGIEWIGSDVNTALWRFTEYYEADGKTPNYYYELQNTQYKEYIAPQVATGQILSKNTIGVNLNGRRYGENYTTIVAWDDSNYAYAGLKNENGHIVACPLSEADDFYFAVINPVDMTDQLTTVKTLDNNDYGITMKMFDFNNPIRSERDSGQADFMGTVTGKGLLTTDIKEDGYPEGSQKAGKTGKGKSLSELINTSDGEFDANHLFLESIYNESGYFEYDSTQNFATLISDEDGSIQSDFTVYDQLGAITGSGEHKNTREHGQFMPFNTIRPGEYAYDSQGKIITYQTDVLANELDDTNARKGEKLYDIGNSNNVDYFFGMEMSASFTQTASGLDAWGHDIIFEFSGDDDFWLYVDGELVIDLGGIHSAQVGTVNFRTGVITSSNGNSTLYDTFRSNYKARNPSASDTEVNAYLNEIFVKNSDGNYVFRDYTKHNMRMFYMERGAGASNLHMRFNLAAVKPGTVVLSKKLSGTDNSSNEMIEFPYQIWYRTQSDGGDDYHLLEEKTDGSYNVLYKDAAGPVTYKAEFTPAGGTQPYEHVFFLKPGEYAVIDLPDDTIDYYITECGVNPEIYDVVKANNEVLAGEDSANAGRKDFAVIPASMDDRPEVDFDNHVSEGAMRNIQITKKLYDVDGKTLLTYPENSTLFNFRLYLGTENASAVNLPLANLYTYYVRDPDGNYCRWDAAAQEFASLEISKYEGKGGLAEYLKTLTRTERESIEFKTSHNGSISKIPAGYSVEVRDLIAGTQYKVEERENEIPRGYTLRLSDGYTRVDTDPDEEYGTVPASGVIKEGESPGIEVRNQKGWGLTVEKVWTDRDFMENHDTIYFAVYVKNADGGLDLLDNSVRELKTSDSSVYYFFGNLQSGIPFDNYVVREVTLEEKAGEKIVADLDGVVTGYSTVIPIDDGGTLINGGVPVGGEYRDDYSYSVKYQPGRQTTQNENVRTDKVINSRPGIRIYKTDWSGEPLGLTVFTLKDAEGHNVAAPSYTSDTSDGLVTTAYLNAGTYTLAETYAPTGYIALKDPIMITVAEDGSISVDGDETFYTFNAATETEMATITVKNRSADLKMIKIDAVSRESIAGVHFALYRQVTDKDGNKVKDHTPIDKYRDVVTNEEGVLEPFTMELGAGTYYLTETQAASGYDMISGDVCFTIGIDGTVVINSEDYMKGWLKSTISEDGGHVSHVITIPNGKMKKVSIRKVDVSSIDRVLAGAEFSLYYADDYDIVNRKPVDGAKEVTRGVTGDDGLLYLGMLESGNYCLVETEAPAGYMIMDMPVAITVSDGRVTAMQSASSSAVIHIEETDIWQIDVWNSAGVEIPSTGGIGTTVFYIIGSALLIVSCMYFIVRRRMKAD